MPGSPLLGNPPLGLVCSAAAVVICNPHARYDPLLSLTPAHPPHPTARPPHTHIRAPPPTAPQPPSQKRALLSLSMCCFPCTCSYSHLMGAAAVVMETSHQKGSPPSRTHRAPTAPTACPQPRTDKRPLPTSPRHPLPKRSRLVCPQVTVSTLAVVLGATNGSYLMGGGPKPGSPLLGCPPSGCPSLSPHHHSLSAHLSSRRASMWQLPSVC